MGTKIRGVLTGSTIKIEQLAHQTIAIDAFNMLYQFLTTIRMRDGTPLKNSKGQTTSHLVGLFARVSNLLEQQLKLVFVYDGEMPELKRKETQRRKEAKAQAEKKLKEATDEEDVAGMKKFAGRVAKLTPEMVEESKQLLDVLGVPYIQAPAEAEAQASHLVKQGDADYVGSQDMDCLLFGAPKMIRNLSITGRRKRPGTNAYYTIEPEVLELQKELAKLNISQKQLIALAMLVGTDFNPGGIKGLGPKKGLKLLEKHGENLEELFAEVKWSEHQDVSWEDVYDIIANMPVTDDYTIEWKKPDAQRAQTLLVEEFEFSQERVNKTLEKLSVKQAQKGLGDFF